MYKRTMMTGRRFGAAAMVLTLGLGLAACGDDSDSGSDPSAAQTASNGDVFNDADVQFATDMIEHHAQAIEMVTLTQGRTLDPQVEQLANEIRDAQSPEVEQMVDWLTAWDQEVPATSMDHANAGHDSDDMSGMDDNSNMPGMMSGDEMDALKNASDGEFQDMWLQMMTEHHKGAVEMAETEKTDGTNTDAISLANSIIETQQAEISTMEQLLS